MKSNEENRLELISQEIESLKKQISLNATYKEWLSGREVTQILNISTRTLQNWRDQGKIGFSKISHKVILYCREDVFGLLKSNYFKKFN